MGFILFNSICARWIGSVRVFRDCKIHFFKLPSLLMLMNKQFRGMFNQYAYCAFNFIIKRVSSRVHLVIIDLPRINEPIFSNLQYFTMRKRMKHQRSKNNLRKIISDFVQSLLWTGKQVWLGEGHLLWNRFSAKNVQGIIFPERDELFFGKMFFSC